MAQCFGSPPVAPRVNFTQPPTGLRPSSSTNSLGQFVQDAPREERRRFAGQATGPFPESRRPGSRREPRPRRLGPRQHDGDESSAWMFGVPYCLIRQGGAMTSRLTLPGAQNAQRRPLIRAKPAVTVGSIAQSPSSQSQRPVTSAVLILDKPWSVVSGGGPRQPIAARSERRYRRQRNRKSNCVDHSVGAALSRRRCPPKDLEFRPIQSLGATTPPRRPSNVTEPSGGSIARRIRLVGFLIRSSSP